MDTDVASRTTHHPSHATATRILIADARLFAESLAWLLSDQPDLEVVGVVNTADAAIALSRRMRPDVVILYFELPNADGVAVAARIRADDQGTQIVMLSDIGDDRHVLAAVEAGCAAFLTKDKTSGQLVAAIRAVAAGEPCFEPSTLARLLRRMDHPSRGVGADLTAREHEVLDLVAQARSNQDIADHLVVSVHTVRNHVSSILLKLGAHSKLEAVTVAGRQGLVRTGWPAATCRPLPEPSRWRGGPRLTGSAAGRAPARAVAVRARPSATSVATCGPAVAPVRA